MLKISVVWKHNTISRVDLGLHGSFHSDEPLLQPWLEAYQRKKPISLIYPLDISDLSLFTQLVLCEIAMIPFGETRSYQEVAKAIGNPKAVRAVGSACGRNPFPLLVPCHRVVGSSGIGGFSLDLRIKKMLLAFEQE